MSEITLSKTNRDHSFDIELACIHCPEKAILLKNFDYWAQENERRQLPEYFLAGKYWTSESLNSLCKKYPYMKKTSIRRWLDELNEQGWLNMVKRQGDTSFFRPGPVFNLWNNGENWQVYQNGTPLKSEVDVYQNGTVSVPKWHSECAKMAHNNIDNNIELNIDSESKDSHCAPFKNQEPKNEIPEPQSEKKSKQKTPGGRAGAGAAPGAEMQIAIEAIQYLNAKARRSFRTTTGNTKGILARVKEGFTLEQIKKMIDYKCREWLQRPEMTEYLNPITLFRDSNFERYYQAAEHCTTIGPTHNPVAGPATYQRLQYTSPVPNEVQAF